jgi:hypothetical protein
MIETTRREALTLLQQAGERIKTAERALQAGNGPAILRELAAAKWSSGKAAAALLADCLRAIWADACDSDPLARERRLDELNHLIDFAWTALCPACRRHAAAGLRGVGGRNE